MISSFLESRVDVATGQGFRVGPGGLLQEAPTLRTFLLDYLGQIDPTAAAAQAKLILNTSQQPDEWAVSLRNLARGDETPEGRTFLSQKTAELLSNEQWQQHPSAGYLEAFDVAVYLSATNLAPRLAQLVRKQDNQAVAHAGFLALDRMVIKFPVEMLSMLQDHPEWMEGRELTRADFFARADLRDQQQRQILERYLLDTRRSPRELAQFAGVFPNANFMISANLLTTCPSQNGAALKARDQESLRVVGEWLSDPRFAGTRTYLESIKTRLEAVTSAR